MTNPMGMVSSFMAKGTVYFMEADTIEEVTPGQAMDLLKKAKLSKAEGVNVGGNTYTLAEWETITDNKLADFHRQEKEAAATIK
jgi:hypothetical protein